MWMTPTPGNFVEWGYLGGLIFIVLAFLAYLVRRDMASAKRELATQKFFAELFDKSQDKTAELTKAIHDLLAEFQTHDKKTAEAIAVMKERTKGKTEPGGGSTPRRRAEDGND